MILIWGEQGKGVQTPELFAGSVNVLGSAYPIYRLVLIVIGLVVIAAVWLFLERSKIGLVIRASLTDKEMARAFGNDIPRIYTFVFASGVAIAALAGALMTPLRGVGPGTGASILLTAFIVVVVGAFFLVLLREGVRDLANIGIVLTGVVFIAIILLASDGLVGIVKNHFEE